MKKSISILIALMLVLSLAACGGTTAPATQAPATDAPAEEPVDETADGEGVITYDFDAIAAWVASGYIGMTDAGEGVVLFFDENGEYAGIFFGDPESGNAASFIGPCEFGEDATLTISDEVNGLALTCVLSEVEGEEGVYQLDMGDLGVAHVEFAENVDDVLTAIQGAIENFNQVA